MASIFQLFGEIFIDNSKANEGIDKTTAKGKEAGDKLGGSLEKVGNVAGKLGGIVAGAAATMATAAFTGAVVLGKEAFNAADEIQRLADVTGFSAEQIQIMQYQGKALGVDLETMTGAQAKLTKAMDAAGKSIQANAKDSKKALNDQALAFQELGVSVLDANGQLRDSKDVMAEAMDKLNGVANETERDTLTMKLFGKSAMELNPLIKAGSSGLADLAQQARETGAVMSNDAVKGMDDVGDRFEGLKQSLVSMAGNVLSSVMPSLQKLMDLFVANLPMIQGLLEQIIPVVVDLVNMVLPFIVDLVNTLLPFLVDIIRQLLPFIQQILTTLLPVLMDLLNMLLPPIMQIIQKLLPVLLEILIPVLGLLAPIIDLLQPIIDLLMLIIDPLIKIITAIIPPLVLLLTGLIKAVLAPLTDAFKWLGKVIGEYFTNAFEKIQPVIKFFRTIIDSLVQFINDIGNGGWKKAWDGWKSNLKNIADGFVAIVKQPINTIIDLINNFINGLSKMKIPDWVPGLGGKSINLPTIPRLKVGLDYVPYDEFPALLHKGERVLTKQENSALAIGGGITINIGTFVNNREEDVQQFAEELEFHRSRVALATGG